LGFLFLPLITANGLISYYFDIILIFIIVWTGESFIEYGLVRDGLPDLLYIYIILIMWIKLVLSKILKNEKMYFHTPGFEIFSIFIIICIISATINGVELLRVALFLRYYLLSYIFFIIILNMSISNNAINKINKLLIYIFVAQIIVGTLKWYFTAGVPGQFGQESFTGTYATHGGSSHVLIPLIAIGFILPMYFESKKKKYVFMILGFIWYSIIGAKRAMFLVLPIFIMFCFYNMRAKFQFNLSRVILLTVLIATSLYLIVILNYTLNPEEKIYGSFELGYVLRYSSKYLTAGGVINHSDPRYYTFGRFASTIRMIKHLINGKFQTLLIGYGPGIALKSGIVKNTHRSFFLSLGIESGITGFIWMVAQVGLLGSGLFIFFIFHLYKLTKKAYQSVNTSYWNVFLAGVLGCFFVLLFDYLGYSEEFTRGEYLLFLFYYFVGISLRRKQGIEVST